MAFLYSDQRSRSLSYFSLYKLTFSLGAADTLVSTNSVWGLSATPASQLSSKNISEGLLMQMVAAVWLHHALHESHNICQSWPLRRVLCASVQRTRIGRSPRQRVQGSLPVEALMFQLGSSQDWTTYNLFLCHFLSTWNARSYEFASVLFTAAAFPEGLSAASWM